MKRFTPTIGMEVTHSLYGSGKITRYDATNHSCTVKLDRGVSVECIAKNGRIV